MYITSGSCTNTVQLKVSVCKLPKSTESNRGDTVKPEVFTYPLFHEFQDIGKFAKTMGHEYSNRN